MIPFSPPRMDSKIVDEVVDTLYSGWITTGHKTKLFEKKITIFFGSDNICVKLCGLWSFFFINNLLIKSFTIVSLIRMELQQTLLSLHFPRC